MSFALYAITRRRGVQKDATVGLSNGQKEKEKKKREKEREGDVGQLWRDEDLKVSSSERTEKYKVRVVDG